MAKERKGTANEGRGREGKPELTWIETGNWSWAPSLAGAIPYVLR